MDLGDFVVLDRDRQGPLHRESVHIERRNVSSHGCEVGLEVHWKAVN